MADNDYDDVTPPAQEVPRPGSSTLDYLQYDVRQAVSQTRSLGRRLGEEIRSIRESMAENRERLVVISGADGDNGKIGNIQKDLAGFRKWIFGVAAVAVTSLGGAVVTIYNKGQEDGAYRLRIENLEKTVEQLRATIWRKNQQGDLP